MRTQRDVVGEIRARNGEIRNILDRVDDEHETLDGADVKRLHYMVDELEDLAAEVEERYGNAGMNARALYGDLDIHRGRSLGQAVVDDAAFKAWLKTVSPRPGVVSGAEFRSSPEIALRSLFDVGAVKAVVSSANAGALVRPDRTDIVDPGAFRRPLAIRDLITLAETDADVVEFVRVVTETNAAAPTEEATSSTTGLKPESSISFELDSAGVKNISHWIPASRRILGDAKQLRGYISGFLRYGLEEELEDQIVTGPGTGENFTGILNTLHITSQTFDSNIIRTARKARTKVRTVGRSRPLAYLMNPVDWEAFDLSTDNEERYYFGGPSILGTPKLWGLPVVECEAVPAGTALVADWRLAMLWDQEQARIYVSDSHADFFARNLIALLAEMRAAFAVLRPAAFVEFALA
ncbi:MAG TPA: phage major capsid protein [Candidatus Kapabacteria bacterium]|nr:phage major capsid protein [Candidatus Kapabacteria bacterium]